MYVPTKKTRLQVKGEFECEEVPLSLLASPAWLAMQAEVDKAESEIFIQSLKLLSGSGSLPTNEIRNSINAALDVINDNLPRYSEMFQMPEDRHLMYGYIFKKISPYLQLSDFSRRSYFKPRGAGDFELMEHIYNNVASGVGDMGRIIDRWCLDKPGAVAVQNRIPLMAAKIKTLCNIDYRKEDKVKIASLACGPGIELVKVVESQQLSSIMDITCVDIDASAVNRATEGIRRTAHGWQTNANGIVADLIRWTLRNGEKGFPDKKHIIYTIGLCDYFPEKLLIKFIDACYDALLPDGTFIMGNFSPYPDQVFMDEILNWVLIYRDKKTLNDIFLKTKFGKNFIIENEPARVNLFVTAKK